MRLLHRRTIGLVLLGLLASGCFTFWKTVASPVDRRAGLAGPVAIRTPIKVHLVDGSTVMFRKGATVDASRLSGLGERYALLSSAGVDTKSVALDSVIGIETFEGKVLAGRSFVISVATTAVVTVGAIALYKAIFGSCPTLYADTGSGPVLQAEGFSYAIAPLLEQRDVDPIRVKPDSAGVIRLELRNEALETHFINHLELLSVKHPSGTRVVPAQGNHLVAVSEIRPFRAARDRAGRDVAAAIAAADGNLFASSTRTVDAARVGDLDDWIDLEAEKLPAGDSIAVVLRMRNSLLNTVLLYEGLLGGRDAPDWMETGLEHISAAIDLGQWYTRTMGMRVVVDGVPLPSGQTFHARIGDIGPLAFRDVAIVLPRPRGNSRIRLRFVADNWRIDYAGMGAVTARPTAVSLPVSRVSVPTPINADEPLIDSAATNALRESDGRYLETHPGQRMTLEFRAHEARTADTTTYLVAWQGYYREWIRGSWLAKPTRLEPWKPGDAAVLDAMHRWRAQQPALEQAFYSSRIPVK